MNEFTEILNLFIANVIAYTFFVAVYGFIIYNIGKIILYLIRKRFFIFYCRKQICFDFIKQFLLINSDAVCTMSITVIVMHTTTVSHITIFPLIHFCGKAFAALTAFNQI